MSAVVMVSAVVSPLSVQAATTASSKDKDLTWLTQSYWYYNAVSQCMGSVGSWNVSNEEDIESGKWYYSGWVLGSNGSGPAGFVMRDVLPDIGDDGYANCAANDNELLRSALAHWGISGTELACGTYFERDNGTDCTDGNGKFNWKNAGQNDEEQKAIFEAFIKKKVYGSKKPSLSGAAKFIYYRDTLLKGCAYGASPQTSDPGGSQVYEVAMFAADGKESSAYFIGDQKENTKRWTTTNPNNELTCAELAALVAPGSANAKAYGAWVEDNPEEAEQLEGADSGDEVGEESSSCVVDGVGWIACPAINFMANIADNAYVFLAGNFLEIDTLLLNTDPNAVSESGNEVPTATQDAWRMMLGFANIAFVIAFLLIIYSQMTGVGITNYGVKKLLPRLIVTAVLVNTSFIISAIAVDLSNLLGYGLKNMFDGLTLPSSVTDVSGSNFDVGGAGGIGFVGIAATVLATAAGLYIALPFLGGAIFAAVIALLFVGFLLIARKALIVLLIVIAPLAFVAYLLPNTEQYFKTWRKMFLGLLLVFPIVGLLFGAGQLASTVLRATAGDDVVLQIVAAVTVVIPLFAVWPLLKGSLNAVGSIGAKINGAGGKLQGQAKSAGRKGWDNSRFGQSRAMRRQRRATNRGLAQAGAYKGRNPLRKLQSLSNSAYNKSGLSGRSGTLLAAKGVSMADKEANEAVDMHQTLLKDQGADVWEITMNNSKASKEERAAAAGLMASSGSRSQQIAAIHATSQLLGSGNKSEQAAAKVMQKQMLAQMGSRVPFALGDQARAAMQQGSYDGNIYQDLANRSQTHLTPEKLANMDIDELTELANMSQGESNGVRLNDQQRGNIADRIAAVEDDDILRNSVADRDRTQFARIRGGATDTPSAPETLNVGHGTSGNSAPSAEERAYFSGDDRRD